MCLLPCAHMPYLLSLEICIWANAFLNYLLYGSAFPMSASVHAFPVSCDYEISTSQCFNIVCWKLEHHTRVKSSFENSNVLLPLKQQHGWIHKLYWSEAVHYFLITAQVDPAVWSIITITSKTRMLNREGEDKL